MERSQLLVSQLLPSFRPPSPPPHHYHRVSLQAALAANGSFKADLMISVVGWDGRGGIPEDHSMVGLCVLAPSYGVRNSGVCGVVCVYVQTAKRLPLVAATLLGGSLRECQHIHRLWRPGHCGLCAGRPNHDTASSPLPCGWHATDRHIHPCASQCWCGVTAQ